MKNLKGIILSMGVATAMFTACAGGQEGPQLTVSGLNPAKFDTIINGDSVKLFTLKNQNGMEVCITNYGGRVVSLVVPDRDGKPTDVVLGFDNIAQYTDTLNSPTDYGSSVGRYATASATVSSSSTARHTSCARTTRMKATPVSTVCMVAAPQAG